MLPYIEVAKGKLKIMQNAKISEKLEIKTGSIK